MLAYKCDVCGEYIDECIRHLSLIYKKDKEKCLKVSIDLYTAKGDVADVCGRCVPKVLSKVSSEI